MSLQEELLEEFRTFAKTATSADALMHHIVDRLHDKVARYNWVGFYMVEPGNADVLIVGAYAGSFVPNARIPLNIGLCGAAASTGETVVVDDVSKDPRYLAGSSLVKSEIVVPIFVRKKLAGELDIESYFTSTFNKTEEKFAQACASLVEEFLTRAG